MSRRTARAAALQALFQIDLTKTDIDKAVDFAAGENALEGKQVEFVRDLVTGVVNHLEALNQVIKAVAIEWELERIAVVERNILRIALYEMCYPTETPLNVAVNEAIELAKTFSSQESAKFINGILGKVLENIDQYRQVSANTGV